MLHKPKIVRLAVPKLASIKSMTGSLTGGRTDKQTDTYGGVLLALCFEFWKTCFGCIKPQRENNFVSYTKSLSVFPSNVIFFDFCHLGVQSEELM